MKEKSAVCPICGKDFMRSACAQKYCSKECAHESAKRKAQACRDSNRENLKCAYCGSPFVSKTKRKYCSAECRIYANGRLGASRKSKPKTLTLDEISVLSAAEGLSYGQYVKKYNL
jgi:endogenous inhibitor of DNA gyrase (YacG/DUF329 family)